MSNMKTFTELLAEFKAAQSKAHGLGVECAKLAYEHFRITGNLTYATHFWHALATNADKNGFMMWLTDFAPAKMVDGKFLKDKEREVAEGEACWRKGAAWSQSFYTYRQVKQETKSYEADDLVTQARRIQSRFQAKGMTPANEAASQALAEFGNVIDMFSAKVDAINEEALREADKVFAEASRNALAGPELGDLPDSESDEEETPLQIANAG